MFRDVNPICRDNKGDAGKWPTKITFFKCMDEAVRNPIPGLSIPWRLIGEVDG